MKDSVSGLEFLGSLKTIAIAHLRKILDGAAFWRLVFLSIVEKLKHNKFILAIKMSK